MSDPTARPSCGSLLGTPPSVLLAAMAALAVMLLVCPSAASQSPNPVGVTTVLATVGSPVGVHQDVTTRAILFTQHNPPNVQMLLEDGTVSIVAGSGSMGAADGVGAAASFDTPWGIAATDSSDINRYVAFVIDYGNYCLRSVNLTTRNVSTFAGRCGAPWRNNPNVADGVGTAAHFDHCVGVALVQTRSAAGNSTNPHHQADNGSGYLYVADYHNSIVRRVDVATATVETFAGAPRVPGSADGHRSTTARFFYPRDIAVDTTGRFVYVLDDSHCVRAIDATGAGDVTTLAGVCGMPGFQDGIGAAARLDRPYGMTINRDGSALYVADTFNCAIRRVATIDGRVVTVSGHLRCGGGLVNGPLLDDARFGHVYGVHHYARITNGLVEEGLLVTDFTHRAIRRVVLAVRYATTSASESQSEMVGSSYSDTPTESQLQASRSISASSQQSTTSFTGTSFSVSASKTPRSSSSSSGVTANATLTASGTPTKSNTTAATTPTETTSVATTATTTDETNSHVLSTPSRSADNSLTQSVAGTRSLSDSTSCGVARERNVSLGSVDTRGVAFPLDSVVIAVAPQLDAPPGPNTSVVFTAEPIPRAALHVFDRQKLPLLLLNISMMWPAAVLRWTIASVTSVRHDEAVAFNATTATTTTDDRHDVLLLLWPPSSSSIGWLTEGLGVYVDSAIVLTLTLMCTAGGANTTANTMRLQVDIPAPGAPWVLAEKVETGPAWATAASSGLGAGSAAARVLATRLFVMCLQWAATECLVAAYSVSTLGAPKIR